MHEAKQVHGDVATDVMYHVLIMQIVLCALYSGGRLGLSYYQVESGELWVMNDHAETDDYTLFKRGQSIPPQLESLDLHVNYTLIFSNMQWAWWNSIRALCRLAPVPVWDLW